MHDITSLDRRGIPGCVIATDAFRPAAAAQSRALGLTPAMAWVAHPIQNRTPAELEALADQVLGEVLGLIGEPAG